MVQGLVRYPGVGCIVECRIGTEGNDKYDEELNGGEDNDSSESYYSSSDSYEEYPQPTGLDKSKAEKEDEYDQYDEYDEDYYYDEYENEDYEDEDEDEYEYVEHQGTMGVNVPIQATQSPNVNGANNSEEYEYYDDDYSDYDNDGEEEEEEVYVEHNGTTERNGVEQDYEYSSYEDEKTGDMENYDDAYYSYSEGEEWEEVSATKLPQIPARK